MGTGDLHFSIYKKWRWFALIVGLATMPFSFWMGLGVLFGYFVICRYISSDLDLIAITSDEGRMMAELKILGVFLVAFWMPYSYIARFLGLKNGKKGHRSFFTHFPLVATTIRLIYMLFIPLGIVVYLKCPIPEQTYWILGGVLFSMTLHDCLHYYYDFFKRTKRIW